VKHLRSSVLGVVVVACASVAAQGPARVAPELLEKARQAGAVRIIVQLQVDRGASGPAIEAVKSALRGELTGTSYRVVRELEGLPLLAIDASYDTLRVLDQSARVLRVEEDQLARPQGN
jgi:hypothetical protein